MIYKLDIAKEEYSEIKVPRGALLLFRNKFHFGLKHVGMRWLFFFYIESLIQRVKRKDGEVFRWGSSKHIEFIRGREMLGDIPRDLYVDFCNALKIIP